jgi:hypothetical protein
MPDHEFSVNFIERVRAGLVPGWRAIASSQGEAIADSSGGQSWMLHPEDPSSPGHIFARSLSG